MDAGVLAAGPVVPPDPLQVRDLDQDQRHDREEEELPGHRRTVSGTHRKRNRPTGLVVRPNLLDGAAEEHRPPARSELRECADEREEDDGEKSEAENEFAGHRPQDGVRARFLPSCPGLPPLGAGKTR